MTFTTIAPVTPGTQAHTPAPAHRRPSLWARKREERLSLLIEHLLDLAERAPDPARAHELDRRVSSVFATYDAHIARHMPTYVAEIEAEAEAHA